MRRVGIARNAADAARRRHCFAGSAGSNRCRTLRCCSAPSSPITVLSATCGALTSISSSSLLHLHDDLAVAEDDDRVRALVGDDLGVADRDRLRRRVDGLRRKLFRDVQARPARRRPGRSRSSCSQYCSGGAAGSLLLRLGVRISACTRRAAALVRSRARSTPARSPAARQQPRCSAADA